MIYKSVLIMCRVWLCSISEHSAYAKVYKVMYWNLMGPLWCVCSLQMQNAPDFKFQMLLFPAAKINHSNGKSKCIPQPHAKNNISFNWYVVIESDVVAFWWWQHSLFIVWKFDFFIWSRCKTEMFRYLWLDWLKSNDELKDFALLDLSSCTMSFSVTDKK